MILATFLETKPLYYKEIDHRRVHIAYDRLKPYIKRPKTVHIVGTNGKGSTGRIIAYLAWQGGIDNKIKASFNDANKYHQSSIINQNCL